ncbi:MAG: pyridoxal-phosphate dependent enzyme [Candidatus Saccharicenans sp.]|nr:pyridoxal-phosphate dependent enzyme [Candidatus Saccharicenans sp.]
MSATIKRMKKLIEEAHRRIRHYALWTPMSDSLELSESLHGQVCFKWENTQPTGSFKIRGAANKILANIARCRQRGVVAASTGNHGLATASVCEQERLDLELFVPRTISEVKRKYLEQYGVSLRMIDGPCELAERLARQEARLKGRVFVSPYNDELVIAGQGTCGLEIWEDWPQVEEVVVPVGGGGLISGIACYLKEKNPRIIITGVEPENTAYIKHSLEAGRVDNSFGEKPTIADAVSGGLEEDSITFSFIQKYVDRMLTVTEKSIIQSIVFCLQHHRYQVEGAGALALAALRSYPELFSGKKVVGVVTGGNIEDSFWEKLIFAK